MKSVHKPLLAAIGLLAFSTFGIAGCNKSDETASSTTSGTPPTSAKTQQNIQKVQADSSIPPEAKAHIMSSMQAGSTRPGPGQVSGAPK